MGLIITRRAWEKIQIGEDIVISVSKIKKSEVKLAIEAPENINIRRLDRHGDYEMPKKVERRILKHFMGEVNGNTM